MRVATITFLNAVFGWLQDLLFAVGLCTAVWFIVTFVYDVILPWLCQ